MIPYTCSLEIIRVMKFYDLDEPDYRELNHNYQYKLPLCLEWVEFMQRRHYKKLMHPTGDNTPSTSDSDGN